MEQKTPEEQKSTEELLKKTGKGAKNILNEFKDCLLYTSPSPRDCS